MRYDIIHELPGRIRVRCRDLRPAPDARLELRRWVDSHREVASARLSTRTGGLLVHYERAAGRERVLILLDDLRLVDAVDIAPTPEPWRPGRAVVKAFVDAALPRPLAWAASGWAVHGAARSWLARRFAAAAVAVARLVLMGLAGSSLPIRFLLAVGFSYAEHWTAPLPPTLPAPVGVVPTALPATARTA